MTEDQPKTTDDLGPHSPQSPEVDYGTSRAEQYKLVYDEARRTLDRQASVLENVHSRAGTLIAAASLATTFLAGAALKSDDPARPGLTLGGPGIIAVLAFVGVVALSVAILAPASGWRFGPQTQMLLDDWVEADDLASMPEMHRGLARRMEAWYTANQAKLNVRFRLFALACILLLLEIIFWLVELRGQP